MKGKITAGALSASTYVAGTSVTIRWSYSCLGGSYLTIYLCDTSLCLFYDQEWLYNTASLGSATVTLSSSLTAGSSYYFWIGDSTDEKGVYSKTAIFSITSATCTGTRTLSEQLLYIRILFNVVNVAVCPAHKTTYTLQVMVLLKFFLRLS